ncbi:MAG: hypothetical protein Q8876_09385 [Bacillota bacterium]|nr:hypothetical protein [Bacillota bacterium]
MKKNGSYLLGALGALIGGLLCSIPWCIIQAYIDLVSSVLACLIGFGAFKAYQMFNGKRGPAAKWIIIVITLIAVVVGQIEAIGVILLRNNADVVSVNIKYLLTHSSMVTIIANFILGIIMALLGTLPASSYFKGDSKTPAQEQKAEG